MQHKRILLYLIFVTSLFCFSIAGSLSVANERGGNEEAQWRIRFVEAAIVHGEKVLLKEVAVPIGSIDPKAWEEMGERELWPSPQEGKGAVNMTRPKLQEAVMATMRDLAPYCLFPHSLALQRGGEVVHKQKIQELVQKDLLSLSAALPGEVNLHDYRLPVAVFMKDASQRLRLDPNQKIAPGRVGLRLHVEEMDGKVVQKLTGSVFVDVWVDVPSAARPLNKEDVLEPDAVTFTRENLAHLRSSPWDGLGGPWRMVRPVGVNQVIYQTDLASIPTIKRGDQVNIVFSGKHILLNTQGEALRDGVVGESIAVKNSISKKEVYAVVKGPNTVIIERYNSN